jgi:hypothetical protein
MAFWACARSSSSSPRMLNVVSPTGLSTVDPVGAGLLELGCGDLPALAPPD